MIKQCNNCAYRKKDFIADKCSLAGTTCAVERSFYDQCGKNYERWKERDDFFYLLRKRIKQLLFKQ